MKLLLFSDVHCNREAIEELVELSQSVDVVVGAGDFCMMRQGLQPVAQQLQRIEKPMVLVPGNAESDGELRSAVRGDEVHVLHGDAAEIDHVTFFGLGGGIPVTPFGSWSFDLSESEAEQHLDKVPPNCVLVTHSPPKGAVDVSAAGQQLGSTAIRAAIVACSPRLAVCGHIHDSWGRCEKIGSTAVVNAGPRGFLWDLETNQPVN